MSISAIQLNESYCSRDIYYCSESTTIIATHFTRWCNAVAYFRHFHVLFHSIRELVQKWSLFFCRPAIVLALFCPLCAAVNVNETQFAYLAASTIDIANTNVIFSFCFSIISSHLISSLVNGVYSAQIPDTTRSPDVDAVESHRFKSMPSKKEPWPSPAPSNQLNNKYFVNQVQSNSSPSILDDEMSMVTENPDANDGLPTIATSRTAVQSIEHHNKYFTSNVSSLSSAETTGKHQLSPTQASPAVTMSPKSRLKSTLNPSAVLNRTKTGSHHHHHQHGKNAAAAAAPVATATTATAANRTHFQIAQKQLTLSKNIRTEPPPMLNHILEALSVSNSKHLHHDHRFVY